MWPIFLEQNCGATVARNRGIEVATGEWITFLDADDLYEPKRLDRLVQRAINRFRPYERIDTDRL